MSRGDARAVTWGPMGTLDLACHYAAAFDGPPPYRPQCELAVGGGEAGRHARNTLRCVGGYPASLTYRTPRRMLAAFGTAAERCPDSEGRALLHAHHKAVAVACKARPGK